MKIAMFNYYMIYESFIRTERNLSRPSSVQVQSWQTHTSLLTRLLPIFDQILVLSVCQGVKATTERDFLKDCGLMDHKLTRDCASLFQGPD